MGMASSYHITHRECHMDVVWLGFISFHILSDETIYAGLS